jgi:hypothetical protein
MADAALQSGAHQRTRWHKDKGQAPIMCHLMELELGNPCWHCRGSTSGFDVASNNASIVCKSYVPTPAVHLLPLLGHRNRVLGSANHCVDLAANQGRDSSRLDLLVCVAVAKLAILPSTERRDNVTACSSRCTAVRREFHRKGLRTRTQKHDRVGAACADSGDVDIIASTVLRCARHRLVQSDIEAGCPERAQ